MKKLILTNLLWIIGMTAFTSAIELNITSDWRDYDPSSYTLENDITFTTSSFTNVNCTDYNMISINKNGGNKSCDFAYNNGSLSLMQSNNDCTFTAWTTIYFDKWAGEACESLTLNLGGSSSNGGSSSDSDWQIIAWWTSTFTPIVEKLGNIATEFIPYLIYIALWALWVALAFKAVKYIISYLSGKAKWAVKGR